MLPLVDLEPQHIEQIVQTVPGGAPNVQDIYPLAPLQEGILFHHRLEEQQKGTYTLPTILALSSRARLDELVAALQTVIDRHDVLRTAVLWDKLPRPVQIVYRKASLPVEERRLDSRRNALEQIKAWLTVEQQPLTLCHAPLMRLQVAADPHSSKWYALLQLHHIVCDHVTIELIIAEAVAHLKGRSSQLPPSLPYRNHVAQAVSQEGKCEAEAFFRAKFGDVEETTAPFGLAETHIDSSRISEARAPIDSALAIRVRQEAHRMGVSVATLFHSAWALVLAHTSGRNDVVFGDVLLGRMHLVAGRQPALGLFINTLPMRLRLQNTTVRSLIEQTQRELVELMIREQASLVDAQKCSAIGRSAPLFTALFNFRHSAANPDAEWTKAAGIRTLGVFERTNYPLTVSVDDLQDGFALTAQTASPIDPQRVIAYLRTAVESLVEALERTPDTKALTLSILPADERRELLESFNATRTAFPRETPIHELFEAQVEKTPQAVAVIYEGESITYFELNARANQLARYLKAHGVEVGECVPILMARSLQLLIAEIAVLKAGGAYLPLDPEVPPERRAFMIRDCRGALLLTDTTQPDDVPGIRRHCVTSREAREAIGCHSATNLNRAIDPTGPAYVMYTSGSTGTPKGVVIPHYAVNRLVINNGYAEIGPTDCLVHHSNPAFDASTFEVWGPLLTGAHLLIVPQPVLLDAKRFASLLEQHEVTVLWMSVGLFSQYASTLSRALNRLRYLIVGGDRVDPAVVRRVLRDSPPGCLMNAYGPTECTTFSTTHVIKDVAEDATSIPIGRPIANAQIYVLDGERRPAPMGVTGEIYIGGAGLAIGYLNRPELTAERFVADPFSAEPNARLYRTGDLGRWRADGAIEFLGRNDHQVKIRGFRIELGELEAHLMRHPQVREAIVLAREDVPGEKRLVAYLLPIHAAVVPGADELRQFLKEVLPEYMIPGAFVVLDQLPLTPNGKPDRKALPAPDLAAYAARDYDRPQGAVEEALADIWEELLGLERVGRDDNFFELGGHSLHGMNLITRVCERLMVELPVIAVFQYPTVREMASAVEAMLPQHLVHGGTTELQEFVL
jgi:amino acid adenylation domain-containing protein